jgi:hypothetical protein
VIGKAADVAFKTTGKYKRMAHCFEDPNSKKKADPLIKAKRTTPSF